jgi:hypothetical protein
MGYTHYWNTAHTHPAYATTWPAIIEDTRRIINAVRATGVVIAGPHGYRRPLLHPGDGIAFNGDATTDLDYGPFTLSPPLPAERRRTVEFCKTGRRPYDLAVAAVLLHCQLLLPDVFHVRSDGAWDVEWACGVATAGGAVGIGARRLVADLFGEVPDTDPVHSTLLPGREG